MKTSFKRSMTADKMRERAVQYASHGWPVAPLAVPNHGRCPCERGDCLEPHLREGSTGIIDPQVAEEAWGTGGWSIALVTSAFDVVDLPPDYGANLNHKLLTTCPTATAPRGRRWHFVLETGSIELELIAAARGMLHSGDNDWIAASPTRTEATGRIGWVVEPHMTHWQPYQRRDLIDLVFGRIEPKAASGLPGVIDEVLK